MPAALRGKIPAGIAYDNTAYADEVDSILRPGIMVNSSATLSTVDGKEVNNYKSTPTGIMIVNQDGELFITVAAHGFEEDGLVWHPTPHQGKIIGTVVDSIPDTNIAIVKLNKEVYDTQTTHLERQKILVATKWLASHQITLPTLSLVILSLWISLTRVSAKVKLLR